MMQTSSVLMVKKKVVTNMAMKIGYIQEIDLQLNPQYKERFRMFSDCYGECTKCHLGIVRPDDSCEFGERRATTHV